MIKLILKLKDTQREELTLLGKRSPFEIPAGGWFVSSPPCEDHPPGGPLLHFSSGRVLLQHEDKRSRDHILKNGDHVKVGNCAFVFLQTQVESPE